MNLFPNKKILSILKHGPRFLYADLHALKNEYRIRKGATRWPRESLFDIIWVDTESIIGTMKNRFPKSFAGCHMRGDWDKDYKKIEDTVEYYFMYNRFVEGKDWENILTEYQEAHGPLTANYFKKFQTRSCKRDDLYVSFKESGWRVSDSYNSSFLFTDELAVNVTRDGAFIRNHSGLHRLIISRFAGIDKVPCRLHVVHSDYTASKALK